MSGGMVGYGVVAQANLWNRTLRWLTAALALLASRRLAINYKLISFQLCGVLYPRGCLIDA